MNVYLVMCEHQPGDREWDSWVVACYSDKEQADAHVSRIDRLHKEFRLAVKTKSKGRRELRRQLRELDEGAHGLPFRELMYDVEAMPLYRHLDEYLENAK